MEMGRADRMLTPMARFTFTRIRDRTKMRTAGSRASQCRRKAPPKRLYRSGSCPSLRVIRPTAV